MVIAASQPRCALMVSDMRDYSSMPSVSGPNWALIALDKCNPLSCLIFLDARVELMSSSNYI